MLKCIISSGFFKVSNFYVFFSDIKIGENRTLFKMSIFAAFIGISIVISIPSSHSKRFALPCNEFKHFFN